MNMSKILYEFKYQVYPEKVDDHINSLQKIKDYAKDAFKGEYYIYRSMKDDDTFNEIFVCDTEEDYEKFEDEMNDEMRDLFEKIMSENVVNNNISFHTYEEI